MRVVVLATDGFERAELSERVKALRQSGAAVDIVSLKGCEIQSMQPTEKGAKVRVDRPLDSRRASRPRPHPHARHHPQAR